MAGLTEQTNFPDRIGKAGSNNGKSPAEVDASTSPLLKKQVEVAI